MYTKQMLEGHKLVFVAWGVLGHTQLAEHTNELILDAYPDLKDRISITRQVRIMSSTLN